MSAVGVVAGVSTVRAVRHTADGHCGEPGRASGQRNEIQIHRQTHPPRYVEYPKGLSSRGTV
jgi:hypothetical protein